MVPELPQSTNQNRKRLEQYLSKMRPKKLDLNKLKRLAAETRKRKETESKRCELDEAMKSKKDLIENQLREKKLSLPHMKTQNNLSSDLNGTQKRDEISADIDPETRE